MADESWAGSDGSTLHCGSGVVWSASVSTRILFLLSLGAGEAHSSPGDGRLSCHIEAGYQPNPRSSGGEVTLWWRGGGVKLVEHHWGFAIQGQTASDRNKGFGAGTEPHAVVGAGAEVSIWPFPLCLTLSCGHQGQQRGGKVRQTAGPIRDHLEPRSASVFRHKESP